jgi:hypothetical protein
MAIGEQIKNCNSRHGEKNNMITKFNFFRIVIALAITLSALGVTTFSVLANPPVRDILTLTSSADVTDVCPFPIHIEASSQGPETIFFDKSGALVKISVLATEEDVISANGKTLTTLPYSYHVEFLYDSSGNFTHIYVDGVAMKIRLPDGTLFITAGRSDFMAHPGAPLILIPDKGTPGKIDAFCAALS